MTLLELIRAAIKEDMPNGDVTTESLALKPRQGRARLKAKEDIVLSGAAAFEQTMQLLEPSCRVKWHFEEGDEILNGQIICTIEGDLLQILKAERVALNFLGHLSGIATLTRRFVKKVQDTSTKILDTRKTTPGFRDLEKRAVVHGGAVNHRMNLSTAILIKDNHISVMGGIKEAISRIREHSNLPIEVETRTLDEVKEAISMGATHLLLDNMNNDMLKQALALIPEGVKTEASGNMNLDRVQSVAQLGVTYISVGALTHSAPCADVSLVFQWEE
ncbi:carboxylating nicotinate-nucleotide diphosphorylase [Bdellovibrio sp. NC01]|uniref:carboxylating nicotinate-nucleotide diphosphorylase n=1 Tax=Bdellovibrio sp. NC01 TaxID=2220073 RepID=UPI001157F6A0|nr:carboxylating nicotinate-nucleotide diphosphorylase [Bdellovibrio sp. NC01]QDK38543.1 carboxylating nicotinate-nucleotide diphosphorylase [Bdellovibrio sp. NC01]